MPRPNVSTLIACLGLFVHHARSIGVDIQHPAPGSTWPAGPLTVSWADAGGSPSMANLTECLLQLVVGGIEPDNYKILANFGSSECRVSAGGISGNIDANVAQSIQNGFYFMMTSNTSSAEQQVINYSSRFTLINMNGTTDPIYLTGANSAVGDDNVPAAVLNQLPAPAPAPVSTSSSTAVPTATSATSPPVVTVTAAPAYNNTSSNSSGVSSGTLIGLALGSLAAIVLGVGLLIWASVRWRRRRRATPRKDSADTDAILDTKPELPDSSVPPSSPPIQLGARQETYEVENTEKSPVEMAEPEMVYELEGDWSPWEAGPGRRSHAWDPTG